MAEAGAQHTISAMRKTAAQTKERVRESIFGWFSSQKRVSQYLMRR